MACDLSLSYRCNPNLPKSKGGRKGGEKKTLQHKLAGKKVGEKGPPILFFFPYLFPFLSHPGHLLSRMAEEREKGSPFVLLELRGRAEERGSPIKMQSFL